MRSARNPFAKQPSAVSELAEVGDFCPNEDCSGAGKTDEGNIVKYGTTAKGLQRYRCKTCGKTFLDDDGKSECLP